MKKISSIERAFTLIELLVVISIIGLLSSVVLASVNKSRLRAKDSKKISTLLELRNAIELYYVNNNNTYPTGATPVMGNCNITGNITMTGYVGNPYTAAADWLPGVTPRFYTALPGAGTTYGGSGTKGRGAECYIYYSNGTDYKLSLAGSLEEQCPNVSSTYSEGVCGASIVNPSAVGYTATIYSNGAQSVIINSDNF
jgi:prepilin-type N-terminal cleavage/methylation domain-containing protein